ncbi:MAG: dihydrolipoyl dehydrogenase [Piscinibacter sp.]|nr:dihydrolipoyl dehydrogenase [Piscinibacter sp.]
MDTSFDLIVIGAGPGGYVAAIRAAQLGLRTAVIESTHWGGVCLNVGCIPAKALLHNAAIVRAMTSEAEALGLPALGTERFSYAAAFARSRRVADGRARGIEYLFRKNRITAIKGRARLTGAGSMVVTDAAGAEQSFAFRHCIVATGAVAKSLPGLPSGPRVVGYRELILSEALPRSIVIVGAGAIGVEFAYLLRAYGVEVDVVEQAPRVLPAEDAEVSEHLAKALARQGIRLHLGSRIGAVTPTAEHVGVAVESPAGPLQLVAERLLVAVGFAPHTAGLGLEAAGVATDERGFIRVDAALRSSVPTIHAIGDVTGRSMFAHVAEAMGVRAAEDIAGHPAEPLDFAAIPRATFCRPQVAALGLTEAEARAAHGTIRVSKFPLLANGKAQAAGDHAGFVKLIGDADGTRLLGAHLVGGEVAELLPALSLVMRLKLRPADLAETIHLHPSVGEAVKDAALGLCGTPINL